MDKSTPLTLEFVRSQIAYDPETGVFTWLVTKKGSAGIGSRAGGLNYIGYWSIGMAYRSLLGHRLAWLLTHGCWPSEIDHINGDRADNRIANLREVTRGQNTQNAGARKNRFGFPGVDINPQSGKYRSRVVVNNVKYNRGGFDTPEEAHRAYLEDKRRLHPFDARARD